MVDGRTIYSAERTVQQSLGSDDMEISQAATIVSESSEEASNDASVFARIATTPLDFNGNVTYSRIATNDAGPAVTRCLVGTCAHTKSRACTAQANIARPCTSVRSPGCKRPSHNYTLTTNVI